MSYFRDARPKVLVFVLLGVSFADHMANAQSFDGWCFPADECTGVPMPIKDNGFGTCEEACAMTNPVKLDGLDAFGFDVICKADHLPQPSRERMIFFRFSGDQATAVVVDTDGVTELVRCDKP